VSATGPLVLNAADWFAAIVPRDPRHAECRARLDDALVSGRQIVTSLLVVSEVHTLLIAQASDATARAFLGVLDDPQVEVVYPDREAVKGLARTIVKPQSTVTVTEAFTKRLIR
jgi:predicted nucleic acid-binding protein